MMSASVTTVMVDTNDLDRAVEFWSNLLALEEVHRTDSYVYLSPMTEGGPHLAFQLVEETRSAKNRLHLDVRVGDRTAAIEWITSAGGGHVTDVAEPGFPEWSVMADPDGNQFCIYEAGG
jgi:catechol 2,3-dioxygenase-like lactoylglutathione lyase family enzyme